MGHSKKDPYPTHRENFLLYREREQGESSKEDLNLYRMPREKGEGGALLISSVGRKHGSLLVQPNNIFSKIARNFPVGTAFK